MDPVVEEMIEDDADGCPDFMEDGFLDNLAVVDSCYSDGEEIADEAPTSTEIAPDPPVEKVPQQAVSSIVKEVVGKSTVVKPSPEPAAEVSKVNIPKHGFIPRSVRAKIPFRRKPIVDDEEADDVSLPELKYDAAKGSFPSAIKTSVKKKNTKINGETTVQYGKKLPTLLEAVHDNQVRKSDSELKKKGEIVGYSKERFEDGKSREREGHQSREREGRHGSRERDIRRGSREREIRRSSRDREFRRNSRDREFRRNSRDREFRRISRDREFRTGSRERDFRLEDRERIESHRGLKAHSRELDPDLRRPAKVTYPNRTWVRDQSSGHEEVKKADKKVEKVREKPKAADSEDTLLPPGTEDVQLPDSSSVKKEAAAEKAAARKRRRSSGDEGRKRPRPDSEEMSRERVERDQERMSRELSRERLKELDRAEREARRAQAKDADRELDRQRAVNEKLNEEIRRMREIRERQRLERSLSRNRSMSRERRRMEAGRSRVRERDRERGRGRRYSELSPVSVGRESEVSFEMSPVPMHMRYDQRHESGRRWERSFSPISSGGGESGGERPRRRKRSPFWLEMERKLGISVVGAASYQYATAKEPMHFQTAVLPQQQPPAPAPVAYYPPAPAMYPVMQPMQLPAPAPLPMPVPVPMPASTFFPVLPPPQVQLPPVQVAAAPPAKPTFRFYKPAPVVPEAPPPPQISGDNMSLTSFLEASVKAAAPPPSERVTRCLAALEALRDDDILGHITSGRFVAAPCGDTRRYATRTRFDHPAQETLMKLKSPLLRSSDVALMFTEQPAPRRQLPPLAAPVQPQPQQPPPPPPATEDIDSGDEIAIIAELPKNRVIDTLDLDPVGDSTGDEASPPPPPEPRCGECARRAAVATRSVGVGTEPSGLCDGWTQSSGPSERTALAASGLPSAAKQGRAKNSATDRAADADLLADDVSDSELSDIADVPESSEKSTDKRKSALSEQYQKFRQAIGPLPEVEKVLGKKAAKPKKVGDGKGKARPGKAAAAAGAAGQPLFQRRDAVEAPFQSQGALLPTPGTVRRGFASEPTASLVKAASARTWGWKTGVEAAGSRHKDGGPTGSQHRDGGPIGSQQNSSPSMGSQQKGAPSMGSQQKSSPSMGSQQKAAPSMGSQQKSTPSMGSQQKDMGPVEKQQKDSVSAGSKWLGVDGQRNLVSFRLGPNVSAASTATQQPLGGNSSFPRDLPQGGFVGRTHPFETQQVHGGLSDNAGNRGGALDSMGKQRGSFGGLGNRMGSFDQQGNRSGEFDSLGNRGGAFDTHRGGMLDNLGSRRETLDNLGSRRETLLDNLGNREGAFDNLGNRGGTFDKIGNRGGTFDSIGNRGGTFDSLGNRGGAFDNLGNRGGAFENPGIRGGAFDNLGTRGGTFDNSANRGGAFDNLGMRGGTFDNAGMRGGTFDNAGIRAGTLDSLQGRGGTFSSQQGTRGGPNIAGSISPWLQQPSQGNQQAFLGNNLGNSSARGTGNTAALDNSGPTGLVKSGLLGNGPMASQFGGATSQFGQGSGFVVRSGLFGNQPNSGFFSGGGGLN